MVSVIGLRFKSKLNHVNMKFIATFLIVMLSLLEQVSAQDTDSLVVKNTASSQRSSVFRPVLLFNTIMIR